MSEGVLRVALLGAGLAIYVGAGLVFGLLAASGPSLDWIDTASAIASAYACSRIACALRAPVDTTFAEVLA